MSSILSMTDVRGVAEVGEPRVSLVDSAYDALKAAIRDNTFAPGYQGSEQEIATQLGMSRTPVHEAIIRLQEDGLIRVLPRRGVVVCALSPADMREIYQVIIAVETASAELLAERVEVERMPAIAELATINDDMASALARDDLDAWAKADEAFHRRLVEHSGNGRLVRVFHTIMDQSHRARMLTLRLRPKPVASVAEHKAIVSAIKDGNADRARGDARRHRVAARDQILPLLEHYGMRHL